jgi:uncharacterized protein YcbK (DUF882 family)
LKTTIALILTLGLLAGDAVAGKPSSHPARPSKPAAVSGRSAQKPSAPVAAKTPARPTKGKKAVRHREPIFTGWSVPASKFRTEPLPRPSGQLKMVSTTFHGETLDIHLYNADGSFNEAALDEAYHFWRCRRTGTEKPIDPRLFELLSLIYDRFQRPIELVSGFRNQDHMSSYHFHGTASDVRIPGVSDEELQSFVSTLDEGSMGLGRYPRAGFIHVDVRPQSFRWIDRSPPSEYMGHHGSKRHSS